jgi:uncharacterized membrane protein YccC
MKSSSVSPLAKSRAFLCEGSEAMNRLAGALIAYLVLGILTWFTISDSRIRGITFVILALFAVKSWVRRKDVLHPGGESKSE